jgi:uncharacterized protein YecE (DUF72 family)
MLIVGTSGFQYRDWTGVFYPKSVKPADRLAFYSARFGAVEINTTYYGIPKPDVFARMVESTPEGFEFVVKANKATTHDLADSDISGAFLESVHPLREAGRLSGVLAQFPWSFRNGEPQRKYLAGLSSTYRGIPLFVEFRHNSWNREEVFRFLDELHLLFVSVDEPQIGEMMPPVARATGNLGYVRFHGRNASAWWGDSADRYNYFYHPEELSEWIEKVETLEKTVWKLYAFFNNCHQGYAVRNALMFKDMVEKRRARGEEDMPGDPENAE